MGQSRTSVGRKMACSEKGRERDPTAEDVATRASESEQGVWYEQGRRVVRALAGPGMTWRLKGRGKGLVGDTSNATKLRVSEQGEGWETSNQSCQELSRT